MTIQFRILTAVLVPLAAWGQQAASSANEVIVKFVPGSSVSSASASLNATQTKPIGGIGAYLIRSASLDTATLVNTLRQRADVVFAEPNYVVRAIRTPNDTLYGQLWGMQRISALAAWDVSTGSLNHLVGVVDTGIDYTHPDLAPNVWAAPAAFPVNLGGTAIVCPKGSRGFNAIRNTCDPMDDHYHGTHVSGTIGASGNNAQGVVGVSWTTQIIGAKFLDSSGSGYIADAVNAIDYLLQAKAYFGAAADVRVLSNSWGCSPGWCFSQALLDEINLANSRGVLFVAAAGNDSNNNDLTPAYPASYRAPNVVAVAATESNDSLAGFSSYGATSVHLAAPGVGVLSTTLRGSFGTASGTSMAAPHVSGSAALILSACPGLNADALKTIILANVDIVPALAGKTATGGRLNVNKAIRSCSSAPPELTLTNLTITSGMAVYKSRNSITASRVAISGSADVTFAAGSVIRLLPEFRATAGSAPVTFRARIQ